MEHLLDKFHREIVSIYTTFKITNIGLSLLKTQYTEALKINPELENIKIHQNGMEYGIEIPREKFEIGNSEYGEFNIILSCVFLSSIYQLWEDKYRQLIAENLMLKEPCSK